MSERKHAVFRVTFRPKHHMAIPAGRILTRESTVSERLPTSNARSGMLFRDLFAYSGGPVPDSHRLPVCSYREQTPVGVRKCREFPRGNK